MRCDEDPGSGTCAPVQSERIRYFTGRHMTARDFRDGDEYHRSHRLLHNRIFHGTGVVCGLDVLAHWNPECRPDRVVVRCGMAIDCCGREILVPKDVVTRPMPWKTRPEQEKEGTGVPDERYVLILCLQYKETCTEKVPVLYNPDACSCSGMEYGRVHEGYELCWRWVLKDDLPQYGWSSSEGCKPPEPEAEEPVAGKHEPESPKQHRYPPPPVQAPPGQQPAPCEEIVGCCLDPACPPEHCVPLAVIVAWERNDMGSQKDIDTRGRPTVEAGRDQLTRICWISWKHGGVMSVKDLDRLEIRFSRPLQNLPESKRCGPWGVNSCTFTVQYGGGRNFEDLDYVAAERPPWLSADGRTAVFELDRSRGFRNLIGLTVFVTLKCDFLLDCAGKAVDGNHLGGRLPTGDGVAGGTFESWFRVVSDREYGAREEDEEEEPNDKEAA
jgi:hypothetical protein